MSVNSRQDSNNMLKIYGLGRFLVKYGEKEKAMSDWTSDKALKMFKYFILNREKELYNERLVEVFWPDVDLNTGKKRLYNTIYLLRKNLEIKDIVVNKTTSYKFNQEYRCWMDWEQFLKIYENIDNNVTLDKLKKAVELYKGDLFPGLRYENWVQEVRTNIKEKYLDILYRLSEELYNGGKYVESLMYLNRGMDEEIYREDYYNLMMKNLAKTGRIYEAISVFENYKRLIKEELGIDPKATITKTYQNIKNSEIVEQQISTPPNSKGALVCDIGEFNKIYELLKRQISRSDKRFVILTIDFSELAIENQKTENIYNELANLFKAGDVICYHNNIINIILYDMNLVKTNVVLDRIFKYFKDKNIGKQPEFDIKEVSNEK